MKVSTITVKSGAIKNFEEKEWPIADLEHYGTAEVSFEPKHFYLAAEDNGQVLGILQMKIRAGVCSINDVLVSHTKRRQGIGKKLMLEAEEIAIKENAHKLFLITGKTWEAADFYRTLGYEVTGERKNDLAGADFIEFTKFIKD